MLKVHCSHVALAAGCTIDSFALFCGMIAIREPRSVFGSPSGRVLFLLCASLVFCLLVTRKAFIPADVDYPRVPMLPFFDPELPLLLLSLLFGLLMFSLGILPFLKDRKKVVVFIALLFLVFFLDDIDRFQPWFFIHFPMIVFVALRNENGFQFARWGMIFMYFWGGLHKLNQNFAWEVFPYLMKPFKMTSIHYLPPEEIGSYSLPSAFHLAWIVPAVELLIALFLLLPVLRKAGVFLAIGLHLITLYILGPFGHNWNSAVWIWKTELLLLVVVLFYRDSTLLQEQFAFFRKGKLAVAFLVLMGIAPVLWYFNTWPHALSYHLYSGYNPQVNFWFGKKELSGRNSFMRPPDEGVIENNPKIVGTPWEDFTFYDVERRESFIMVDHHAMKEMNVPIFAEEFYFRLLGKKLCKCFGYSGNDAGIRMELRTKFKAHLVERSLSCRELLLK